MGSKGAVLAGTPVSLLAATVGLLREGLGLATGGMGKKGTMKNESCQGERGLMVQGKTLCGTSTVTQSDGWCRREMFLD